MTTIHHSRVNLFEKDIEDWLWENPDEIAQLIYATTDFDWVARQFKVPSGILDLLGIVTANYGERISKYPLLVEVKNQPVTSSAITQVCRYAHDVIQIIHEAHTILNVCHPETTPYVKKIVIAPEPVDSQVLFEANALDVGIHTFSVSLSVELNGRTRWTHEARQSHRASIEQAAQSDIMKPILQMVQHDIDNSEVELLPLPFTKANGDCSFMENGDLR